MTPEELRALEDVRGYSRAGRVTLTEHARQRMSERGIRREDLLAALFKASSCCAADGGRWKVTGPDRAGEDLTAVVALEDGVLIVTVF